MTIEYQVEYLPLEHWTDAFYYPMWLLLDPFAGPAGFNMVSVMFYIVLLVCFIAWRWEKYQDRKHYERPPQEF